MYLQYAVNQLKIDKDHSSHKTPQYLNEQCVVYLVSKVAHVDPSKVVIVEIKLCGD